MTSRLTRSRKPQPEQQPDNQLRAKWTAALTKTLVDLMVDQIQKGNKSNKSFSKKGWKFICDNFRVQTGYWWDNDQVKSRYIALRKQYINVSLLLNHHDFKWDETTSTILATDEAWVRYIKEQKKQNKFSRNCEHPDAEALRTMGCPIFNHLQIIFGEPGISEKRSGATNNSEETPGLFPSPRCLSIPLEELSASESEKYADLASRKRGRKGMEDAIAKGILEMAAATKLRAEAIKKHNEKFSMTDCVKAMDELQGVNDQVYFAALDLFRNRSSRETFLSLKVEKRLIWLQGKCSANAPP